MSAHMPESLELLLTNNSFGILGTHFSEDRTFPFCSLVQYIRESKTSLILKTAYIAEHHKNLEHTTHASLFISEVGQNNQSSGARLTLLMECEQIPSESREAIRSLWSAKTQKTIPDEIENSFCYWRATIKKIRWIAGFGEMGWESYL
jgi:hypothetical protein